MEEKKFICEYCNKEFNTIQARAGHYASCKIKLSNSTFSCQFCEKSCASLGGLTTHENSCNLNPNRVKKMRPESYLRIICDKCGRDFAKANFDRHYKSCTRVVEDTAYHLDHDDLFCKWCEKEFSNKNSLVQHECRCKSNPNAIVVKYYYHPRVYDIYSCQFCNREFTTLQGRSTHETFCQSNPDCKQHIIGEYYCQYCSRLTNTKHGNTLHEKSCSLNPQKIKIKYHISPEKEELRRKHISETAAKNKSFGGLREVSGRGKSGWYKGIHCDSTWELAWVIYALDHNIKFERNKVGYPYTYKGKEHLYYPDFLLEDDSLIEIKGYMREDVPIKLQAVTDRKIKLLVENNLKPIFEYIYTTYHTQQLETLYEYTKKPIIIKEKKKKQFNKNKLFKTIEKKYKKYLKSRLPKKLSGNCLPHTDWEARKEQILNSGVDLTKFGWVNLVGN